MVLWALWRWLQMLHLAGFDVLGRNEGQSQGLPRFFEPVQVVVGMIGDGCGRLEGAEGTKEIYG